MDVGFTGTRQPVTGAQRIALHDVLFMPYGMSDTLHHGDCIGADELAHDLGSAAGMHTVVHPPILATYRAFCDGEGVEIRKEKEYLARDRDIVDETELLVALPSGPMKRRSGTWYTVRYARKRHKPITIIWPDGRIEKEN